MPVPQLIVTNAPYKKWPGGIITFRATDWLGASGATTETDARAIEGEVVRETQATASVVRTAELTAFQNADDTLEIDLTGVPVELNPVQYNVYASILIEGDWDTTNLESYRNSSPVSFEYTARLGLWGDSAFNPNISSLPSQLAHYPRKNPHYSMVEFLNRVRFNSPGNQTLHVIAFAGPGSTVEWLIDQIVLVPFFDPSGGDIMYMPAEFAVDQIIPIVDGADGGDANGKFTWHPQITEDEPYTINNGISGDGGGDYQQDDSEYLMQIPPDEGYFFGDSGGALAKAHAYSIHGAYYRDAETWELDEFTRTVVGDLGLTPRGFHWAPDGSNQNAVYSVNGSRGNFRMGGIAPRDTGWSFWHIDGTQAAMPYAAMRGENFTFSGILNVDGSTPGTPWWDGLSEDIMVGVQIHDNPALTSGWLTVPGLNDPPGAIIIDVIGEQWMLRLLGEDLSSWIDISSWFALGSDIGFKIELKRHRVRARVWDAGGSEPSTWDVDDWRPVRNGATVRTFDYSNDPVNAIDMRRNLYVGAFASGSDYVAQWDLFMDDFRMEYDPVGDIDDVHALMEAPDGNEVGRITIPSGAWHFVYWGSKSFVENDAFGDPNLSFSTKVWSEVGAAELQRAEAPFWWFRSAPGGIISMNWSRALPVDITRVHG